MKSNLIILHIINNRKSYKMIAGCNTRISLLENATYSFEERR